MNTIEKYDQHTLTLRAENKIITVVPWTAILGVSYGPNYGSVVFADDSMQVREETAFIIADLLRKVLKGIPIEDIDFDSEG